MDGSFLYRLTATAAGIILAATLTCPAAHATSIDVGISGTITVSADLAACASVASPAAMVGQFSVGGALQPLIVDPHPQSERGGSDVQAVQGAVPIVASSGRWSGCLSGGFKGPVQGVAVYTLEASGAAGDHVTVVTCTVLYWSVSCR